MHRRQAALRQPFGETPRQIRVSLGLFGRPFADDDSLIHRSAELSAERGPGVNRRGPLGWIPCWLRAKHNGRITASIRQPFVNPAGGAEITSTAVAMTAPLFPFDEHV